VAPNQAGLQTIPQGRLSGTISRLNSVGRGEGGADLEQQV